MKMKNAFYTLAAFAASAPVSLFADSLTVDNSIITTSDVTDIFTTAQSDMSALIDAALPVAISFVTGGLVIWGVLSLIGILKRGFSAGKGR